MAAVRRFGAWVGGAPARYSGDMGLMMEGGIQVNLQGRRFSNEHQGYSEQAESVLAQPEKTAFNIFDARLRDLGHKFEDFRNADESGAVITADTAEDLAGRIGIAPEALAETFRQCAELAATGRADDYGRRFDTATLLAPPYSAVRVTGALFHTQGGLLVDDNARVRRKAGGVFGTIYACGGAACGVSGPDVSGYLSGNGLLTALALGHLAGRDGGT